MSEISEAVQALTEQLTRLSSKIIFAEQERDAAVAAKRVAERSEEEWRGIVETYGIVRFWVNPAQNTHEWTLTVDGFVAAAAGRANYINLFVEGVKKAFDRKPVPHPRALTEGKARPPITLTSEYLP